LSEGLSAFRNAWPWLRDPCAFLDRCVKEEESRTFIRHIPLMGRTLFTGSPGLIRSLVGHPKLASGKGVVALRRVLGDDSLIMLDGEAHAERKKLVHPSFHGPWLSTLDGMYLRLAEELSAAHSTGEVFPVYPLLHRISLEAIARVMFGEESPDRVREGVEAIHGFIFSFSSPLMMFLKPLQVDLGPWSPWGRAVRARARLRTLCQTQLDLARSDQATTGIIADIARRAAGVTDSSLITEVLTLLMFGHDTAATTMAWAMGHIHQNREIALRARREALESDSAGPGSFPFLQACINESMRLRPVVVHLTRVVTEPFELGGFSLEENDKVAPSPWLAHRCPSSWPSPSEFDPGRFGRNPKPFTFLPFGIGHRTCVGRSFVLRQMPMIIAGILRSLDLELATGYDLGAVRQMVLMAPQAGCPMRVRQAV
jgi:cytochrome P450 family 110